MSIAEKLTTIAENQQRVYDAGYTKGLVVGGAGGDTEGAYNAGYEDAIEDTCVNFEKTGDIVVVQYPVPDYPISVVSDTDCTVKRCGKNLINAKNPKVYHSNSSSTVYRYTLTDTGAHIEKLKASTSDWGKIYYYIGTREELVGKTITAYHEYTPSVISDKNVSMVSFACTDAEPCRDNSNITYSNGGYVGSSGSTKTLVASSTNGKTITYTVKGNEEKKYIIAGFNLSYGAATSIGDWFEISNVQVEIGRFPTSYEPYNGETFTATADEVVEITPLEGVNCLLTDNGSITVSGTKTYYEGGHEAGRKDEYDFFWSAYQQYGAAKSYSYVFAGTGWNDNTFKPKYNISIGTGNSATDVFRGSEITDLKTILEEQGVYINASIFNGANGYIFFNNATKLTHIGRIIWNTSSNAPKFGATFNGCKNLHTIDSIDLYEGGTQAFTSTTTFANCTALENLTITGKIGQNGFNVSWSPLTHDSLMSIINALQEKTSGTWTVTLGTDNLAKLTDAEKAIATEKGWTLA